MGENKPIRAGDVFQAGYLAELKRTRNKIDADIAGHRAVREWVEAGRPDIQPTSPSEGLGEGGKGR